MQAKVFIPRETIISVALGGAAGVGVRYGLLVANQSSTSAEHIDGPLLILLINIFGSGFLGFLLAYRSRIRRRYMALLGTGFCGGLTTFSGFAVTAAQQIHGEDIASAAFITLSTPIGCFISAGFGFRIGKIFL